MPDITAARPVAGQPIETAWGDQMHDAMEGIPATGFVIATAVGLVAVGNATSEALKTAVIDLTPYGFTGAPRAFLTIDNGAFSYLFHSAVAVINTTTLQIQVTRSDGLPFTGPIGCGWQVIGPR